jgi:hypothetical protein
VQKISDREQEVVQAFLDRNASENFLMFPITALGKVLRDSFGWSLDQGRVRAAAIVEELEQAGAVECKRAKNGTLRGIMVIAKVDDAAIASPAESAVAHDLASLVPTVTPPKTPPREKGVVRRERLAHEKGSRNETRFYRLVSTFLELLRECFPENVLEAQASKSGVHNPRKGRVDMRDHHGDDVRISVRVYWDGASRDGELIYDAKSSDFHADLFNREVRLYPEQRSALLKRAIVVGEQVRDADILTELVKDMVAVNLVPAPVTEAIFERLSPILQ